MIIHHCGIPQKQIDDGSVFIRGPDQVPKERKTVAVGMGPVSIHVSDGDEAALALRPGLEIVYGFLPVILGLHDDILECIPEHRFHCLLVFGIHLEDIRHQSHDSALTPGTEIIVDGYQSKDRSNRANGRDVTFTDGRKIFMGSSGTGAPQDGRYPAER